MKEHLIGDVEEADVESAPPPSDADLGKVAKLAADQIVLAADVLRLETELKSVQAAFRQNAETDLPLAMKTLGLTSFTLEGGGSVKIEDQVFASIKEDQAGAAFAWLEKHGHGDLIKHEIKLLFPRGEEKWAKKFLSDLSRRKRAIPAKRRDFVEPSTLKAFVREQDRKRTPVPDETFGVFRRTVAVVEI